MADLADRIYLFDIDIPGNDNPKTTMRIAFACELMDAYPDADKRIISFMSDLDLARNLLVIQSSGKKTRTEQVALLAMPRIVLEKAISGAYPKEGTVLART